MSYGKAGAEYENKINLLLKKAKLQRPTFFHNPYNNDQPDSVFVKKGKAYGIELKHVYNTSFGSYTIKHNLKKWVLAEPEEGNEALYKTLKASGIEKKINDFYNSFNLGVPLLFTEKNLTPEQRIIDVRNFGGKTKTFDISARTAEIYYSSKGVNYIQIQRLGFYYLKDNPAKIDCPKFVIPGMQAELRLKKEEKKDGRRYHRFVVQIKPTGMKPNKSPFNIDEDTSFLK